jgi:hypothetical protein
VLLTQVAAPVAHKWLPIVWSKVSSEQQKGPICDRPRALPVMAGKCKTISIAFAPHGASRNQTEAH